MLVVLEGLCCKISCVFPEVVSALRMAGSFRLDSALQGGWLALILVHVYPAMCLKFLLLEILVVRVADTHSPPVCIW